MRHRSRACRSDQNAGAARRDPDAAHDPARPAGLRRRDVRGRADDGHDDPVHCGRGGRRDPATGARSGHCPRVAAPQARWTRHCLPSAGRGALGARIAPGVLVVQSALAALRPRSSRAVARLRACPRCLPLPPRLHGRHAGDGGGAHVSVAPRRSGRVRRPGLLALRGRDRLRASRRMQQRVVGACHAHDGADVHYRSCSGVWDHRGSLRDVFPRCCDCRAERSDGIRPSPDWDRGASRAVARRVERLGAQPTGWAEASRSGRLNEYAESGSRAQVCARARPSISRLAPDPARW